MIDYIKEIAGRYDFLIEIVKFNPYHGSDGRFVSGPASGPVTFSEAQRKRYNTMLVGRKASGGTTVKRFSYHAYERAVQRNITPECIIETLKARPVLSKTRPNCNTHDRKGYRVVLDFKTGTIVSVMLRGSKR